MKQLKAVLIFSLLTLFAGVVSAQIGLEFTNTSLDMGGNNITNFFNQAQCGGDSVVQQVYPNGSYECTPVDTLSGAENLSETLSAGNIANRSIIFSQGILLGNSQTSSSTPSGVAVGKNSSVSSDDPGRAATAVGSDTNATGRASTAVGQSSGAIENYSTAYGGYSNATDEFASSFGYGSEASAKGSVAIGPKAQSVNPYQTTIGNLRNQRQDLNVTGNLSIAGSNIRFTGQQSNLTNFFNPDQCGADQAIKKIFPNGSYICLDVVAVSGDENLSETLEQGNEAGEYNINLDNNNLTEADSVFVQRKLDLENAMITKYFGEACKTDYGVTEVFDNGSLKCETGLVPGPYPSNLSDTLSVGQSAGEFFINMNNNSIRNASYISIGTSQGPEPEKSYISETQIGPDRDDLSINTSGYMRAAFSNRFQFYDSGEKIAAIDADRFDLNSTVDLGDNASIQSSDQNLALYADQGYNISMVSQQVDLNNSELLNYFGDSCSSNSSIQGIYPNGTFKCLQIEAASGTEGLATTLAQSDEAGNNKINMSGNRIVNLSDPEEAQDAVTRSFLQQKTTNSTDISDNGVTIVPSTSDVNFGDGISAEDDGDNTATVKINASDIGATGNLNETLENGNSAGNNSIDMNGNDIEMNGGNVTAGNADEFCIGYCGG